MTTHDWLKDWCSRCGCARVDGRVRDESGYRESAEPARRYFVVGDREPRFDEPPCEGWSWASVEEVVVVRAPLLVAAVRVTRSGLSHAGLPQELVGWSLRASINDRFQILSTDLVEAVDKACFLPERFLVLPGMTFRVQAEGYMRAPLGSREVSWLVKSLSPEAALVYFTNLTPKSVQAQMASDWVKATLDKKREELSKPRVY